MQLLEVLCLALLVLILVILTDGLRELVLALYACIFLLLECVAARLHGGGIVVLLCASGVHLGVLVVLLQLVLRLLVEYLGFSLFILGGL